MKKTILDLIKKTKADALENINDISRDFVNENALENINYLDDNFHEQADQMTSVYYADQKAYFYEHTEECENALLELYGSDSLADIVKHEGLEGLLCKAGACGEYENNLCQLYENEDEIKECLTLDYLERYADDFPKLTESDLADILNETHCKEQPFEIVELLADISRSMKQ